MSKTFGSAKELKVGKFVIIDDVPCKVVGIDTSSPGKHGAAKMRIAAIGIFNGQKKTLLKPSDADVEIPIIERKTAQIVSVTGDSVQLMDLQTYETFDLPLPAELESAVKPEAGKEAEYLETMGKRMITRVRE